MRWYQMMLCWRVGEKTACTNKRSLLFTQWCAAIFLATQQTFFSWWVIIWHQHSLASGHFECFKMPTGCYCTCKPSNWMALFEQQERAWETFFACLRVLGGGHILYSFPDSTAVQHHVDPDRSDLCAPHLTHLCSTLVTTTLLNGRPNLTFCARWREASGWMLLNG